MKVCRVCGRCYDDSETICRSGDDSPLVADRAGDTLVAGKYRLERLLGRGGVGAVYAATHVELEISIAVKLLHTALSDDPNALARFRREAQSAARLHHPGIARTHDFGILPDGGAYLVMDLVDGPTLRQMLVERERLGVHEATRIARQVLEAIDAAHGAGIIHRDLKPSNIIVTLDHRNQERATVVDFGLAKIIEDAMTMQGALTNTGMFIGTPRYMSPEQCQGEELDPRSDIYSLGIILYEMLAGRPPFDAPSVTALALKHLQDPPPPIRTVRPDVPEDLEQAIEDALGKTPDSRPATAGELARRLREIEGRLASNADLVATVPAPAAPESVATTPAVNGRIESPPSSPVSASVPVAATASPGDGSPTVGLERRQVSEIASQELQMPRTIDPVVPAARPLPPASQFSRQGEQPARRRSPMLPITIIALVLLGLVGGWLLFRDGEESAAAERRNDPAASGTRTEDPPASTADRTVPGKKATPVTTWKPSTPAATPSTTPVTPAFDRKATTDSLGNGFSRWIATMNARDIDAHIAHYDTRLSAFYLERNVDRERVRQEKEQLFRNASRVSISSGAIRLSIAQDGQTATMRFPKSYTITTGAGERTGEVLSELGWRRTADGWKIVSERDLRVVR